MLPVIAIVGRPNVGKSTLFNCLTRSRDALVADLPGVTRDRKYGEGQSDDRRYIVIDTGGIEAETASPIHQLMTQQSKQAIAEADLILFVVDAKEGLMPDDALIAQQLRETTKPCFLVVNKTEGISEEVATADFYQLGFKQVNAIASAHKRGINKLMSDVLALLPATDEPPELDTKAIKIAFIGRPNVGKSTLINRILGEERVLVFDQPGTTRDSIFIPFSKGETPYVLIDTAGVRRRSRIDEEIEKFSVIKSLQTIEVANVVIYVMNAREGVLEQDLRLLDFVVAAGKALVIVFNKWDKMPSEQKDDVKQEIARRLEFVKFARKQFISALYGTGVGDLFGYIQEAYVNATKKISTQRLTRILQDAVSQHQPPLVHGRRIKLKLAHAGGYNPPLIVIHGNQTESLPLDYRRYLVNTFITRLKMVGTPIKLELKSSENPYKDKKNILTPRQQAKKKRLIRYNKK